MTPAVLEAPTTARSVRPNAPLPRDAILSLEQAATLIGETFKGMRDLSSLGLLRNQLIDGERCVWLSDLIAYKTDYDRRMAAWKADPLNHPCDETPNPFDVLPEYEQMLEP